MCRRNFILSLFAAFAALSYEPALASAQNPTPPKITASNSDPALNKIASQTIPLPATVTVAEQASVEAVLIPASLARRIFGQEVANNYAAVELVVSNKDSKAALIVQSVFLDYSQWLLSGLSSLPPPPYDLENTQKPNRPWQVASVEARLIRGQLIDAQQWTKRNWTVRALTAIGSVAAGFQFPFAGDVAKGIAAFNGEVVPGVSVLWPDGTTNQINRITDFGFQTNKIIPKEASDIIVAFFPIDRFLTPGFHKMFVSNPAGFFMPAELLADPKTQKEVTKYLLPIVRAINPDVEQPGKQTLVQTMSNALLKDCSSMPRADSDCRLQGVLGRLSLNSVRVVVGGVMSVDLTEVPPTIYSVDFKDGNKTADIWTTLGQTRQGTITGLYLTGGTPSAVNADGDPIGEIQMQAVTSGSSDTKLAFTMTLKSCLPPSTPVFFVVTKATQGGAPSAQSPASSEPSAGAAKPATTIRSTPFLFALPHYSCPAAPAKQ